jgi:hypothetical protein
MHDAMLLPMPTPLRRGISGGMAASIALHLALAFIVIWLSPLKQLVAPPPEAVSVEIVTAAEFAALQAPAPAVLSAPPANAVAPAVGTEQAPIAATAAPEQPAHATHRATTLYAADMLREPAMARIRQTLTQVADNERIVQLCNIEGLEQIKRSVPDYAPDALVAYAMSDPLSSGFTLTAAGGAFRSRRKWYGVSLRCTVAPDYQGVTAFEFTVGEPIPEEQWEAHNLNAEDADE